MKATLVPQPMVVVEGDGSEFTQHVTAGAHEIVADEPVAAGGHDTGLSPYQLLLAALGSCTSMTLGLYARRKQWPLMRVRVELSHVKMTAGDRAADAASETRSDRITRLIHLHGPLSSDQRQRLVQIADRCPVHRTLTSQIEILTSVADPEPPCAGERHETHMGEPAINNLSATVASYGRGDSRPRNDDATILGGAAEDRHGRPRSMSTETCQHRSHLTETSPPCARAGSTRPDGGRR